MKTFYHRIFIGLLFSMAMFSILLLVSCAVDNDDDAETSSASYKLNSSPEMFANSILSSVKSAISRKNNQVNFHKINSYLATNHFTNSKGEITTPTDRSSACTSSFFNGLGSLTQSGDIQSGQMVFINFCIGVADNTGNIIDLLITGTIGYDTNITNSTSNLSYDIVTTTKLEKHIYFGDVEIELFKSHDTVLVNRYIDSNNVEYYTEGLNVSGNINQGYHITGTIDIGQQGSIGVRSTFPIIYGDSCGVIPESGKLDISTAGMAVSFEAAPRFCQIRVCTATSNSSIETCTTI